MKSEQKLDFYSTQQEIKVNEASLYVRAFSKYFHLLLHPYNFCTVYTICKYAQYLCEPVFKRKNSA